MVGTVVVCVSSCVYLCVCEETEHSYVPVRVASCGGLKWAGAGHIMRRLAKEETHRGLGPGHIKVVRLDEGAMQ